jgi:hypothetical protein
MVTATMVYTVELVSLRCVEAQELDGDHIHLKFNGQTVWSSNNHRMHPHPTSQEQIDRVDFVNGKQHGVNGWEVAASFSPADFVFRELTHDSEFQLWERDIRSHEEVLGKSPVSVRDAGHGNIAIVFAGDAARYVLTYHVTV